MGWWLETEGLEGREALGACASLRHFEIFFLSIVTVFLVQICSPLSNLRLMPSSLLYVPSLLCVLDVPKANVDSLDALGLHPLKGTPCWVGVSSLHSVSPGHPLSCFPSRERRTWG